MYKILKPLMIISSFIHKFKNFHIMPFICPFRIYKFKNNPLTIVVKGFYNSYILFHSIVLGGLEVMS